MKTLTSRLTRALRTRRARRPLHDEGAQPAEDAARPAAVKARVEIYSSAWCGYCRRALRLLDAKGVDYVRYDVDGDDALRAEMMRRARRHTVPQVFIDGAHVGGCDELLALERSGRLDALLGRA